MATSEPRSVRQKKKAINKRSSDEDQTADAICSCRASKKTLCQYCKKSPKKFKLQKDKITDNVIPGPEVVPSVVTDEHGSRFVSRYWNVNFSEYFWKNFKKVLEIKLKGWCWKIKLFKQKIWAPISNENVVEVYNKLGSIERTIDMKNPWSVEEANNDDIFIACQNNSGLFVMHDDDSPQKILVGSFADVYAHQDKVYALEYKKKRIMEFCCRSDVDDVKQRWRSEKAWRVAEASADDKVIVTGDADLQLYVSHNISHKISQYNTQGQCIKRFGSRQETGEGNLHHPWLCGVDRQSHLLVADHGNNVYKILDPGTGQWRSTGVRGEGAVFDATLDDEGNMWLCQHNGKGYIITKHEPQTIN